MSDHNERLLAAGVCESVERMTGPRPRKSGSLAAIGWSVAIALGLLALSAAASI